MSSRLRNIFFFFGLAAVACMFYSFDFDFSRVNIFKTWPYLIAVVAIWIFVYGCNAEAYRTIINCLTGGNTISYRDSYRLTVSGFSISFITPFGSGGGPYRILELQHAIGINHATSSTVLYSMMHVCSHFCLWTTAVILFPIVHFSLMTPFYWVLSVVMLGIAAVVFYFFNVGYKNGMIVKFFRLMTRIPFLGRPFAKWEVRYADNLKQMDLNIALLHQYPKAFWKSLFMEYAARLVNCFEFMFIFLALDLTPNYFDALFVLALSSLVGNLLFFFPMQVGAREGGLAIMLLILGIPAAFALYCAFYTRLREIIWVAVGVLVIKLGKLKIHNDHEKP